MCRMHAGHHASFMPQRLCTTFTLDIASDATPSFRLSLGGGGKPQHCSSVSCSPSQLRLKGTAAEAWE
ncbi:hypothetical protein BGY98DRAFT_944468 [Russula aff. rugulosa BPL654]|nr:hypothetical protein BGY98DRAFT_944468 [Russula aff. rugulosa BPL654]